MFYLTSNKMYLTNLEYFQRKVPSCRSVVAAAPRRTARACPISNSGHDTIYPEIVQYGSQVDEWSLCIVASAERNGDGQVTSRVVSCLEQAFYRHRVARGVPKNRPTFPPFTSLARLRNTEMSVVLRLRYEYLDVELALADCERPFRTFFGSCLDIQQRRGCLKP